MSYGSKSLFALLLVVAGCTVTGAPRPEKSENGSLFEPPAGRVLHGWGQMSGYWDWDDPVAKDDARDLDEYDRAVGSNRPAIVSFYVAPVENQVAGFVNKYPAFVKERSIPVAQVGLYFMDAFLHKKVATGGADDELRRIFRTLREAGVPVLLRVGYEFNSHWNPYDLKLYVTAYRRVTDLARAEAPGLVATVWHAEPEGFADRDFMEWYPGDEYVDWWGISLFYRDQMTDPRTRSFMEAAARHWKPVLIGECSPWFRGEKPGTLRGPASLDEAKGWYDELFGFIGRYPQVKGINVIVVDWTRWNAKFSYIPGGLPDVRFDRWPGLDADYRRLVGNKRFIHAAEARAIYGRKTSSPW
jgi:hypothetical protein